MLLSHSVVFLSHPMDCSMPWFPALHYLPGFAQTHVHWVDDAIQPSHSVTFFSSCPQSFPASGSSPVSQLLASGGQSIGDSASASVLPLNIQDWFPLGLTGLISLQSKGLSRIFSYTTIQKHQFFSAQLSLWLTSHICIWLPKKPRVLSCFSHVWLFVTLWTVASQAPLSLGFARQKYWSGLLFPSLEDLPNPGIEPMSLNVSCIDKWILCH